MSRIKGKAATDRTLSETVVVGVDVSKNWLDVFLHPMGERVRVENDATGIGKLLTCCLANSAGLVVMEATGRYHRAAHTALHEAGIQVAIINPYSIRRFAHVLNQPELNRPLVARCSSKKLADANSAMAFDKMRWKDHLEKPALFIIRQSPSGRTVSCQERQRAKGPARSEGPHNKPGVQHHSWSQRCPAF